MIIFICSNFITLSTALAFDLQWYGQSGQDLRLKLQAEKLFSLIHLSLITLKPLKI